MAKNIQLKENKERKGDKDEYLVSLNKSVNNSTKNNIKVLNSFQKQEDRNVISEISHREVITSIHQKDARQDNINLI